MQLFVNDKGRFCVNPGHDIIDNARVKGMPQSRWWPKSGYYTFKPIISNFDYLKRFWAKEPWPEEFVKHYDKLQLEREHREKIARGEIDTTDGLLGVPMRMPPREHQRKALVLGRDLEVFAYFMDQGTGKSKVFLDDVAHNFREDRIDAAIIICPNTIKENWVDCETDKDEITKHMAPDVAYDKCAHYSSPMAFQRDEMAKFEAGWSETSRLKLLAVGVESIRSDRVADYVRKFAGARRCIIAVDESTTIKTPGSSQSKQARDIRHLCHLARILTGTPIIKSPLDIYAQFEFLDPNILGFPTWTSFKKRYAIKDPFQNDRVVGYQNLDELQEKMKGTSFRVLKSECLDLPPKIPMPPRHIQMTEKQAKHYDDMRRNMITWLDQQHVVKAKVVITQMLRLHQITSGFLPLIDPVTQEQTGVEKICDSPKIEDCLRTIEENDGKAIVWCRFKFEISEMMQRLAERKIVAVKFDGTMKTHEQTEARVRFQEDENCRVFVGQIKAGGRGLTLTAANLCNYLSNTFETELRVQSEDRPHRDGLQHAVVYNDFIVPRTVDVHILEVIKSNRDLSGAIVDGVGEWKKWI